MSAAEAHERVLRPVPEIPPEGPHRTSQQEFYPGIVTHDSLIDNTQAVRFSPQEMEPVLMQARRRVGDQVQVVPHRERGVVLHCSLIVETGKSNSYAASDELNTENLTKDLQEQAVQMLPPIGIADGKELLEPRIVGMVRNRDISEHETGQPLTLDGEALTRTLALLLETRDRPEVTIGELKFFREPTQAYGYNLVGPAEPGMVRLVGLAYDTEQPTTQVVPLDNPEIRRRISDGTIKLGALAMLGGEGEVTMLGSNAWREDAAESPYPCMLLHGSTELPPVPVEQELADNLRMLITSTPPSSEANHIPPAAQDAASTPVDPIQEMPEINAAPEADGIKGFFKAPADFGLPTAEGAGQPSLGFREDDTFGYVANPAASKSRMFRPRGRGIPGL